MSRPRKTYSVHDVDGEHMGRKVRGWVLIEEELDADGEIVDTEMLAFYKTHDAALRALTRAERDDK